MSNYVLQISLEGADKADAALDSLLKKVGSLSSGTKKMSFGDFLSHDPMATEKAGEEMGKFISKGVSKKLMSFNIFDAWGKGLAKFERDMRKFWDDAVKVGMKSNTTNGGSLAQFINQRHAPSGKEVEKDFWLKLLPPIRGEVTKGLRDVTGKDLAKVSALGDISEHAPKIKGLREITGADLAKVQGLGDITQFDKIKEKLDLKKILTGLFLGVSNPYIGSRVLSDELGKKLSAGKEGGIAGGLFGKGGIAGFSEIFLAFKAFKLVIDVTSSSIRQMGKAIESADRIYTKALEGGMGIQMTTKRSILAQIMGVSERDVFRFGAQMAYLNPRLEQAVRIISQTAKPLAQVSWEFKILQTDLDALFADMANDATPALINLSKALDNLVKTAIWLYDHAPKGLIKGAGEGALTAVGNLTVGFWATMAAKLGLKLNSALDKSNAMPDAAAWTKQLPASHWERMGLVTMGGTQNYAKETAKNTKEIANYMKALAGRNSGKPQNSAWGMSMQTAQP